MKSPALANRRAWLSAFVGTLAIFAFSNIARSDVPAGWKAFKGDFFEIGVPPGFTATAVKTGGHTDSVRLSNASLGVVFEVYSPQWDGEAPFKKAMAGEKIVSNETRKAGKETAQDISIEAKDGSYIRFVLSQSYANDAASSRTNKTFGIKAPNMKAYAQVKSLYIQWKKSLTQFAD